MELWRNRGRVKRLAGPGRRWSEVAWCFTVRARVNLLDGFPLDVEGRCLLNFGCGPPSLSLTRAHAPRTIHGLWIIHCPEPSQHPVGGHGGRDVVGGMASRSGLFVGKDPAMACISGISVIFSTMTSAAWGGTDAFIIRRLPPILLPIPYVRVCFSDTTAE